MSCTIHSAPSCIRRTASTVTATLYRAISFMPLRTRSGWFAPQFWETNVEHADAMAMTGMLVKENSFRAAV